VLPSVLVGQAHQVTRLAGTQCERLRIECFDRGHLDTIKLDEASVDVGL
jgi:hypothetical protein